MVLEWAPWESKGVSQLMRFAMHSSESTVECQTRLENGINDEKPFGINSNQE